MSTLAQPAPPAAPPPYRTPRSFRRALGAAAGVLALALVVFGALNLLDLASRHTTVQQTSHADVRALVVEDASDLRLTGAPAGARLEVVARLTEGLQSPEHSIAQDAEGTLRLSSSCPGLFSTQCRVRYDIRVPAGTTVHARTSAGDIGADDLRSAEPIVLRSSAGDIAARGVTAPALELSTSAGDVEAGAIRAARVQARSDAGDVSAALLEPADRLDAATNAGDVELVVPDAAYRLDAGTSAGDVDSSGVRTDPASPLVIRARSRAGDVSVVARR